MKELVPTLLESLTESLRYLETIAEIGAFDEKSGTGSAFQIDVEDALVVNRQIGMLSSVVEEEI